jgi:hypothetical protein
MNERFIGLQRPFRWNPRAMENNNWMWRNIRALKLRLVFPPYGEVENFSRFSSMSRDLRPRSIASIYITDVAGCRRAQ